MLSSLYLEIDGVLIEPRKWFLEENYISAAEIRPYTDKFFDYIQEQNISILWLSNWPKENLNDVTKLLGTVLSKENKKFVNNVVTERWLKYKAEIFEDKNDFLWIDVSPPYINITILEDQDKLDMLYRVDSFSSTNEDDEVLLQLMSEIKRRNIDE